MTDNFGNPCKILHKPYISNCGFSVAARFIQAIYVDAKMSGNKSGVTENVRSYFQHTIIILPHSQLKEFDQSEFIKTDDTGMDSTGYIYVPSTCQNKTISTI